MKRTRKVMKTTLAAATLASATACGALTERPSDMGIEVDGIPVLSQPISRFDGTCTYVASTKAVTILADGTVTTLVVSKRASDSVLLVNGYPDCLDASGVPLKVTSVKTALLDGGAAGAEVTTDVVIDFLNGTFLPGTSGTSGAPGIVVKNLAASATFSVRGSGGAENLLVSGDDCNGTTCDVQVSFTGKTWDIEVQGVAELASANWLNDPIDAATDPKLSFSLGAGNDSIRFAKTGGTGTSVLKDIMPAFPTELRAFVFGDEGNDTVYMGSGLKGAVEFNGGPGTDTASYGERTANLIIEVDGDTNSASAGAGDGDRTDTSAPENCEWDDIQYDVEVVQGGSGSDVLIPGARGDTVNDGAALTLKGGPGNDFFWESADSSYKTVFDGEAGTDTVLYDRRGAGEGLFITMGSGANDGEEGEEDDVKSSVEQLVGGGDIDDITGSSGPDVICGGPGGDALKGGGGDDTFAAVLWAEGLDTDGNGTNDDHITFLYSWTDKHATIFEVVLCEDEDSDSIEGGAGVDLVDYSGLEEDYADPRAADATSEVTIGTAAIEAYLGTSEDDLNLPTTPIDTSTATDDIEDDVENCYGSSGDDVIAGNASANNLDGKGGDDVLYGFGGADTLEAVGTGTAECFCGDGADIAFCESDTTVAGLATGTCEINNF